MQLLRRVILFLFTGAFLLIASPVFSGASKEARLEQLTQELHSLQSTLKTREEESALLQEHLKSIETRLSELNETHRELNNALLAESRQLSLLKKTQTQNELKLKHYQKTALTLIRLNYMQQNQPPFKMLLNEENPNLLDRRLYYDHTLTAYESTLIQKINTALAELERTKQAVLLHQKKLQTLLTENTQQLAEENRILENRQATLNAIASMIQTKQQRILQLQSDQKRLQSLIVQLNEPLKRTPLKSLASPFGKFTWPLPTARSNSFIKNPNTPGIVLPAKEGTPVHAVAPGKIVFADWLRGYGFLIIIDHGHGYMSLYARNESLKIKNGDYVNSQNIIALTGKSGGYEKSGLYFEIRQNGIPVNSLIWLKMLV